MTRRKLICFDFDGVLSEGSGYHWPLTGLDLTPIHQAHARGYAVAVMTCNDVHMVARELKCHGIDVLADYLMDRMEWHGGPDGLQVLVTGRKLCAHAYVDDRAVCWQYGDDPAALWREIGRRHAEQQIT